MKVINLFGGPGSGKSTIASYIFNRMKLFRLNVEYVTEEAKDFTWEERYLTLSCQPYVFAKQMRNIWRLKNKVDFVVTDSPILLSCIYGDGNWPDSFFKYVIDQFNDFNNINLLINPLYSSFEDYEIIGRKESREEAGKIHKKIHETLDTLDIPYYHIINVNLQEAQSEAMEKVGYV